jgi:mannose-6-phosphate isomerase-like protein (cupin superfamily)
MFLKKRVFRDGTYGSLVVMFMAVAAFAQQPSTKTKTNNAGYPMVQQLDKTVTYASAADVAALIESAKKESKSDAPMVVGEFLKLDPYTVTLEYHEKGKPLTDVGLHPKVAEFSYVLQGSGTMVIGGTRTADHMRIEGGESQKLSKGDFIIIPEGTPHWINQIDQTLVLMSIHVPRPVPAQ